MMHIYKMKIEGQKIAINRNKQVDCTDICINRLIGRDNL